MAFALFCHRPPLQAPGLTENTVRRSWVNWEICAEETSLHQLHVAECVPGDQRGTGHPKATGQQMARHEGLGLAVVWLLRGTAQIEDVEGMAGPVGKGIPWGTPEQRDLGGLETVGLLWPQLQTVQIAAFQNSLSLCTSAEVLILQVPPGQQKCFVWCLQRALTPIFFAEVPSPLVVPYLSIFALLQVIHEPPFS